MRKKKVEELKIPLNQTINNFIDQKNIDEEEAIEVVEKILLSAYKSEFGDNDNAFIKFDRENDIIELFSKKKVREDDDVDDHLLEIGITEALSIEEDIEIGDVIAIKINTKNFRRSAIQTAKQTVKRESKNIRQNNIYAEFKDKVGQIIVGNYQRKDKNTGDAFIDLGKYECFLPKEQQSPLENYSPGDRIKVLVLKVDNNKGNVTVVLSRTDTLFIRRLLEIEIPEIKDRVIEIYKIVREPGLRTKIAVYTIKKDMDPVKFCIGMRGNRINAIKKELEGETINIIEYSNDITEFIKNSLSPAKINYVKIVSQINKKAVVIVEEDQLNLAIGKLGSNVKLANYLIDWNINLKTKEQAQELGLLDDIFLSFKDSKEYQEIVYIHELPNINQNTLEVLNNNNIEKIEELYDLDKDKISSLIGINTNIANNIDSLMEDIKNYEIKEDDQEEDENLNKDKNLDSQDTENTEVKDQDDTGLEENEDQDEEVEFINELGFPKDITALFENNNIKKIIEFIDMDEDDFKNLGFSEIQIEFLIKYIKEELEIEEE